MLVRMKVGLSGPDLLLNPGDEHPFPDDEAQRLIDADFAERAEPGAIVQTPAPAVAQPEAAKPKSRAKRK